MKNVAWSRCVVVALISVVAVACTPAPTAVHLGSVWSAGDSNTVGVGGVTSYPRLLGLSVVAVAGTGLTSGFGFGDSIGQRVDTEIALYGLPSKVTVMGGTNDFRQGVSLADVEAAAMATNADLTSQGIAVVWITPPPFGTEAVGADAVGRASFAEWEVTALGAVDCWTGIDTLPAADDQGDGVHLTQVGQQFVADCVQPSAE